ncbi:hypothetical protein M3J07_001396 [Ascochyta lentis]
MRSFNIIPKLWILCLATSVAGIHTCDVTGGSGICRDRRSSNVWGCSESNPCRASGTICYPTSTSDDTFDIHKNKANCS